MQGLFFTVENIVKPSSWCSYKLEKNPKNFKFPALLRLTLKVMRAVGYAYHYWCDIPW